jgi:uncharacterized membrane protein YfcA
VTTTSSVRMSISSLGPSWGRYCAIRREMSSGGGHTRCSALGSADGAYLSASVHHRVPEATLRRLLGCIALAIATRYLYLGAG